MKKILNTVEFDNIVSENKIVVADFFADWCGPCKMLGPEIEKVSEANTDVVFVKVNVDDNIELAQRYGVMSIPTVLAFKDSKLANQFVGYIPGPQIQKFVDSVK